VHRPGAQALGRTATRADLDAISRAGPATPGSTPPAPSPSTHPPHTRLTPARERVVFSHTLQPGRALEQSDRVGPEQRVARDPEPDV